jgi:hypothetical protein
VLLDGWKDLCLPVLRALEPKLAPGGAEIGSVRFRVARVRCQLPG